MKKHFLSLTVLCLAISVGTSCSDDDHDSHEKRYAVGDLYDSNGVKGIVYKVTDGGHDGLIVSLDETTSVWAIEAVGDLKTNAIDTEDGEDNMEIIAKIADWQTKFPAFAWCASKNTGGVRGWFLPAYYQLDELWAVWSLDKDAFNKLLTDNGGTPIEATSEDNETYWSSSENLTDPTEAASQKFLEDRPAFLGKTTSLKVRAVHEF